MQAVPSYDYDTNNQVFNKKLSMETKEKQQLMMEVDYNPSF